jgi:hypothetical protein
MKCFLETSIDFQRPIWHYSLEDNHQWEHQILLILLLSFRIYLQVALNFLAGLESGVPGRNNV